VLETLTDELGRGWAREGESEDALVRDLVLLEDGVSLELRRVLGVGRIEELLDADEDLARAHRRSGISASSSDRGGKSERRAHLLDRDRRLPRLLLVQDRQADGAGRVDVRVVEAVEKCEVSRRGRRSRARGSWAHLAGNLPARERERKKGSERFS